MASAILSTVAPRRRASGRASVVLFGPEVMMQILYRDEIEAMRERLDLRVDLVLSEPPPGWDDDLCLHRRGVLFAAP